MGLSFFSFNHDIAALQKKKKKIHLIHFLLLILIRVVGGWRLFQLP